MMFAEVSVKVLPILSTKSIGGSRSIYTPGGSIGNTFLMKYRYRFWQYFQKVLLTTLYVYIYVQGADIHV